MSGELAAQAIANRLSLREPQRRSLEILARVCELLPLSKEQDLGKALQAIQSEYPELRSFDERSFPSFCFALATGVGKTRLMGAFIAWLHRVHGINDFLVLAPNLTIYRKLITDFTPNTPKYVFQGVSEFALNPPEVVTGDNYESGRGVRRGQMFATSVVVNVFNISKINAEFRGDRKPKVKSLIETIGEAYFDYLAGLDRLVVLMDESHRYRASAGVKAINDLRPVLGLELTATPQIETSKGPQKFGNVIYSYPLANAITEGFVKKPAVASRKEFRKSDYTDAQLERLKLEDGVRIHEVTKVELENYAKNEGLKRVKPFVMVVARDTSHAEALLRTIESDEFFLGRYRGKVITVHSNQRGEEKDEVVEQLLSVEDPENPVEIVIHVNMLREGWDVTNLFTIIPLRTADSKTLVEQSIGRGLRLPYGKRTGNVAVDRLTIVAHDRFQEIVDYANDPNSVIRSGIDQVFIDPDDKSGPPQVIDVQPAVFERLFGDGSKPEGAGETKTSLFDTPRKQLVARTVMELLPEFERLPSSRNLMTPEVQAKITERVREALPPQQADLTEEPLDLASLVRESTDAYVTMAIDIARVVVQPKTEVHGRYRAFELNLRSLRLQPVERDILIQSLADNQRYELVSGDGVVPEKCIEDYVVRALIGFDDVSYDDNSEVLYSLADQVVRHLRGYLEEDGVANVLQYHARAVAELVHGQMQAHYEEPGVEYEVVVNAGFRTLHAGSCTIRGDDSVRLFRAPVPDRQKIPQMLFGGFQKSVYAKQRFQSDSERRFAVILENDNLVLRWIKPQKADLMISLPRDGGYHVPDFVVETADAKYLCEIKAKDELRSPEVLEKAKACLGWCEGANQHARQHKGKPWSYLLIPHDDVEEQRTLAGLVASYTQRG